MATFVIDNWQWLVLTGYELIVRAIPTSRSWSIFIALSKLMQLIPDRAKKEGDVLQQGERIHVVKLEKRFR